LKEIQILLVPMVSLVFTLFAIAQAPEQLWVQTYGGDGRESFGSAIRTNEGGLALAGFTSSGLESGTDIYFVVTDEEGEIIISESYTEGKYDNCYSLFQTSDSGFILAGITIVDDNEYSDILLVKLDNNGNQEWSNTFGGDNLDRCNSVIEADEGGYLICAYTRLYGNGERDVWIIKTDENGDQVWSSTFGDFGSDVGTSVYQSEDGGFTLTGYFEHEVNHRSPDLLVIKIDEDGENLRTDTYDEGDSEYGQSILENEDNGYSIAGIRWVNDWSYGYNYLVRLDSDGNKLWSKTYVNELGSVVCNSHCQTNDGGYALAGYVYYDESDQNDFILLKTEPDTVGVGLDDIILLPQTIFLSPPFPNPFNSATTIHYGLTNAGKITINVFDNSGRQLVQLFDGFKKAGFHAMPLDLSKL